MVTLAEEKGGVSSSSLSFKGTCTKTGRCEQSCFWQGKKDVVLHYHWELLTKACIDFSWRPKESYQLVENGHPMSPLNKFIITARKLDVNILEIFQNYVPTVFL